MPTAAYNVKDFRFAWRSGALVAQASELDWPFGFRATGFEISGQHYAYAAPIITPAGEVLAWRYSSHAAPTIEAIVILA